MRQGLLPATEYLSRRFRFSPQAYASRACLLVFALQSTQLAASRPPVWGYQMYLGPGEFKVFSDASAAASFGCSNINNTSNSAVENVTQTGINLSISCSFDNVNGDRSYGAARPASWGPACPAGMAFNGEVCEGFDENKKKPCPDPSSGNPIRTLTGVKVQRETDINTKAPAGIKFERIFDSRTAFAAGISLGPHWRHNFDAVLRFTFRPLAGVSEPVNLQGCNTITDFSGAGATQSGFCAASALQSNAIVQLDGAILERAEVGLSYFSYRDGKWQAAPGSGEQLEELLDNNGLSRWRYRNMSGLAETFNDIGKLVERSENGMRYDLEYAMPVTEGGDGDSSTLDRVSSVAGEEMRFTYVQGLLASVVDAAGARYRYAYTEGDNAAGLRQLEHVSYPDLTPAAAGNNPWGEDNPFRSYHYEHGTFKYHLTGITNENRLRYVSWDYNPQRRAILSRRAGQQGEPDEIVQLDFSYLNDGASPRIIEINPHGKETVYHFEEVAGLRLLSRIEGKPHTHADIPDISCAPAHQYYQHDANGFLSTVTDWEGNVTRYERDAFGRELQRTEGLRWADGVVGTALQGYESARVTITRWHPRWNHPVRKLAAAQVTDRQYDCDSGLVLAERRYARGAEPAYVAPVCSPPE